MQTVKYVHWQEGDGWLGYLEEYPDDWTQGDTLDDLVEHLKDLYLDLSGGHIPGSGSVADAFGTAPVLRTADDILARVRAEREEWGDR